MKRSFAWLLVTLILAASLLAACAGKASTSQELALSSAPMEEGAMDKSVENYAGNTYTTTSSSLPEADVERIVIKNASLTLVVSDPPASMERIKQLAEAKGGFVVNAYLSQTTLDGGVTVPQATITIRVPAGILDDVLKTIRAESDELPITENINSQDVTSDYTDLQSRLRNLINTERQLNEFLEATTKTEDTLSVYNQLVQIREQIEVIQGQINYYEQSAALSSISVELKADAAVQPLTIGSWQPKGVAKSAVQALISFSKGFVNFLIWLVLLILPVLAMIFAVFGLPVIWITRRVRRNRKQKAQAEASKPEPATNSEPPAAP